MAITHWATPTMQGEVEDNAMTCVYVAKVAVSKYDNVDQDPRTRIYTQAKFQEIEELDLEMTFDGVTYQQHQMTNKDVANWEAIITAKIKRELENHVDDFNWSECRD